jgi:hypothetical protein
MSQNTAIAINMPAVYAVTCNLVIGMYVVCSLKSCRQLVGDVNHYAITGPRFATFTWCAVCATKSGMHLPESLKCRPHWCIRALALVEVRQ